MINEERAFIKAATAEPDEDTLRLAYADWLDEQGDPVSASQASFVRLQVRRSRLDVFDPDRANLLEQEVAALQKHKRDWNGRTHRRFHASGLRGLVDSRHGLIRGWHYHRGMVGRVAVTAEGLATYPKLIFRLGPVQALDLVGWRVWSRDVEETLEPYFAGVRVVSLRWPGLPLGGLGLFKPLRQALLLDLRYVPNTAQFAGGVLHGVTVGDLPPVVLFRRAVQTSTPYTYAGHQYTQITSKHADHVIDPFNRWNELRLWYADLTGEVLTPIRYQGTTR